MVKTTAVLVAACGAWLAGCGDGGGGAESGSDGAATEGGESGGGGDAAGDADADADTGETSDEAPGGSEAPAVGQGQGVETDPRDSNAPVIDEAGHVGFRAEVQMELETLPGTPAAAVQKMGGTVQRRMAEIRGCYDRAVASDPEIQGVLKLLLETNARRIVSADVTEAGLERGRITECVIRVLRRLPRNELPASARLWVVLRASNTMAHGMSQVRDVPEGH